ncbi:hypothetical protein [Neobacillus mesonae]|uniref:Chorismate synthase n=1 Tax=Neobacillus mesonae TaxID=1193713 RepID=A0A3Q9QRT9_9BACI|nr:hypothetical protein [Neobacillus mesonae]AZU60152.1 hypothetical protein CHR53_02095 [Neobacillus mesonae]MED4203849.1 chorismate synthase [Neobacillus mesonae]
MFNWFKTGTEIKRDEYLKLYERLADAVSEHDKKVSEASSAYRSYTGTVPNLSNSKIPSNDFDNSREKLNAKLQRYFQQDQDKRSSLVTAKNQAYSRYVYYKNLAIHEAQEKARKEREERERAKKR